MKNKKIQLRSFVEPLSDEERTFYGLDSEQSPKPVWPERCVNSMEPAAGAVPLAGERSGDSVMFHVPLSAANLETKKRNFGWVTRIGIWIAYVGVIGFFVIQYFAFSLSEQRRIGGDLLFLLSVATIVVAFLGFYFVQFVRAVSPEFRRWLDVPAVKIRIKRSTPYFHNVSFEFGNDEYAELFVDTNQHLSLEHLDKVAEEQLSALQQEIEENRENPSAHFDLGVAHERLGDLENAESEFKRALELDDSSAAAWRHIGACRFARGDVRGAEQALAQAESIDPEDVDTSLLFAALYEATNRNELALTKFQAAKNATPVEPDIHVRIGEFHMRLSESAKAIAAFEDALMLDPEHGTALTGLAMVFISSQDSRAAEAIKKLKSIRPEMAEGLEERLNNFGN